MEYDCNHSMHSYTHRPVYFLFITICYTNIIIIMFDQPLLCSCDTSICRNFDVSYDAWYTGSDRDADRNSFCCYIVWLCYLFRFHEQFGTLQL